MAKIMLVEDDDNLRQIYEDSLSAEGHTIVTAGDGEEALALAVKEKPDLILADIMMPKVSGFDMLDILRTTPETKDAKIVMMTALSQAEDKARAEKLGADKYLVKSQVTLQDVMKIIDDMLGQDLASTNQAVSQMTGDTSIAPQAPPAPTSTPPTITAQVPVKTEAPAPKPVPVTTTEATTGDEASKIQPEEVAQESAPPKKIDVMSDQPKEAAPAEAPAEPPKPAEVQAAPAPQTGMISSPPMMAQGQNPSALNSPTTMKHEKRIEPTADMLSQGPKINDLLTNSSEPALSPPSVDTIISPSNGTPPPTPSINQGPGPVAPPPNL